MLLAAQRVKLLTLHAQQASSDIFLVNSVAGSVNCVLHRHMAT